MTFHCDTTETCEGTVCRRCRLWPDMCTCNPSHALWRVFAGVHERISGQGWVPETQTREPQ